MSKQKRPPWQSNTDDRKTVRQKMMLYLKMHGIPENFAKDILISMTQDAIMEAEDVRYDRFFCAMTLALRRTYNFGPVRTLRYLHAVDDIFHNVADDPDLYWDDLMQQCRDETGFVIHTDEGSRLVLEYNRNDIKDGKEVN